MKHTRRSRWCTMRVLQTHNAEIAKVHAAIGKRFVKLDHKRFVLRSDRTNGDSTARRFFAFTNVLGRIRSDCGSGQIASRVRGSCNTTRASSATIRLGEARSGLISISLIQRCSITNWLNRTSNSSSAGRSIGSRPRKPLKALEDSCSLHQAARECAIQRRKPKRAIFENFDKITARAEQQHRTELAIDTAAKNELITAIGNHRLHRHAKKCLGARTLCALEPLSRSRDRRGEQQRHLANSISHHRRHFCA